MYPLWEPYICWQWSSRKHSFVQRNSSMLEVSHLFPGKQSAWVRQTPAPQFRKTQSPVSSFFPVSVYLQQLSPVEGQSESLSHVKEKRKKSKPPKRHRITDVISMFCVCRLVTQRIHDGRRGSKAFLRGGGQNWRAYWRGPVRVKVWQTTWPWNRDISLESRKDKKIGKYRQGHGLLFKRRDAGLATPWKSLNSRPW